MLMNLWQNDTSTNLGAFLFVFLENLLQGSTHTGENVSQHGNAATQQQNAMSGSAEADAMGASEPEQHSPNSKHPPAGANCAAGESVRFAPESDNEEKMVSKKGILSFSFSTLKIVNNSRTIYMYNKRTRKLIAIVIAMLI